MAEIYFGMGRKLIRQLPRRIVGNLVKDDEVTPPFFMQATATKQPSAAELLLADLERRQDDVLEQLDQLDRRLCEVLESISPGCTKTQKAKKELEPAVSDDE